MQFTFVCSFNNENELNDVQYYIDHIDISHMDVFLWHVTMVTYIIEDMANTDDGFFDKYSDYGPSLTTAVLPTITILA